MSNKQNILIGTSGWSYEHWVEKFYPPDLAKREWIIFYAQHFNTVELNMSFYRFPFKNMLQGWKKKLPDTFEMTMKANRQITHRKRFKDVGDLVTGFYDLTQLLAQNKGCILFQAPPSFENNEENMERLKNFLTVLDPDEKNVIEFRHPSWWQDPVYQLLRKYNVAFCVVSGLDMPAEVIVTADIAYFRFHGPEKAYASQYSDKQLREWSEKINQLNAEHDLKALHCYFNNDMQAYAVQNAQRLSELINND